MFKAIKAIKAIGSSFHRFAFAALLAATIMIGCGKDSVTRQQPDYRAFGTCVGGEVATGVNPDTGDLECAPDNDTTYSAGDGLALEGGSFSVDFNTAARSDHGHDDLDDLADELAALRAELEAADYCPRLVGSDGVRRRYVPDLETPGIVRCVFGADAMVKVGDFWADTYEAALVDEVYWNGGACDGTKTGLIYNPERTIAYPDGFPPTGNATVAVVAVYACSRAGVAQPSLMMTWFQAASACVNAGKRLCTNAQWQTAASGTPDPGPSSGSDGTCVTSLGAGVQATGSDYACQSRFGAESMVGNAWEWVADWFGADSSRDGQFAGTMYSGDLLYDVDPADNQGGGQNFPAAAVRGGAQAGDGSGAGVFALDLSFAPSATHSYLGARCCAGGR